MTDTGWCRVMITYSNHCSIRHSLVIKVYLIFCPIQVFQDGPTRMDPLFWLIVGKTSGWIWLKFDQYVQSMFFIHLQTKIESNYIVPHSHLCVDYFWQTKQQIVFIKSWKWLSLSSRSRHLEYALFHKITPNPNLLFRFPVYIDGISKSPLWRMILYLNKIYN